jgi:hypothetical protein
VLYEHKSYSYRWVTVQLLRYLATIWQRLTGETDKHVDGLLPEILPVVIYHGSEPWAAPLQFAELVEGGRDAAHVPHYEPVFVDLTRIENHLITGPLRLMLGLVALKYARKKMTQADVNLLTELLHRGSADPATRHLVQVVEQTYVTVKPESEVQALVAAATRLGYHEVEGGYMTYAEAKRRQGLEEGSLQRSREVLIRQLDRKFGLTAAERESIMACEDQTSLDAALDEILDASSKALVLAKLP